MTTAVPLKLMSSAVMLTAEVVVFALVNVPLPVKVNVPAPFAVLLSASTVKTPVPLSTVTPVFTVIPPPAANVNAPLVEPILPAAVNKNSPSAVSTFTTEPPVVPITPNVNAPIPRKKMSFPAPEVVTFTSSCAATNSSRLVLEPTTPSLVNVTVPVVLNSALPAVAFDAVIPPVPAANVIAPVPPLARPTPAPPSSNEIPPAPLFELITNAPSVTELVNVVIAIAPLCTPV